MQELYGKKRKGHPGQTAQILLACTWTMAIVYLFFL